MSLKEWESKILIDTVDMFIDSALPVSSSGLQQEKEIDLSGATIRNIMANLEKLGYLRKAHNQSGRIPTTKGYKFYTTALDLNKNELVVDKELITKLDDIINKRKFGINNVIEETVKVISEITDLVTIAKSKKEDYILEAMNLFIIDKKKSVITIVSSGRDPVSKVINNPKGILTDDLKVSIDIFNERLKGTYISELKKNVELITPLISQKVKNFDKVLELFTNLIMEGVEGEKNYKSGTSNIINYRDVYDKLDRKKLLSIIEDNSIWKILEESGKTSDSDNKLTFTTEEDSHLDNIVIINREINVKGVKTSFALAAPKRVKYKQIATIFDWLESKLELINNGEDNE
ncbi:MAG: hypothetical protein HRS57_01100 [Mycoplasmataceae bacterium]|nr:hypothetical protein [Mycoplasmataceae bacterium]